MRDLETINHTTSEEEAKLQYEYMEKAKAYHGTMIFSFFIL